MPIVMSVLNNNTTVQPRYNKGPRDWQKYKINSSFVIFIVKMDESETQ